MKNITALILSVIILLAALPALAVGGAALPSFSVTLNGVTVDNEAREYPFLVYKDITYFPMTFYDCRFLGLETEWSAECGLEINKTDITSVYFPNPRENERRSFAAEEVPFKVAVNGKTVDNSSLDYPLLLINDVTYFPLTWELCHDEFGWDYSFDEGGLVINSGNIQFEKFELDIPDMYNRYDELQRDARYIAIAKGRVYYMSHDGIYSYIPGEIEAELFASEYKLSGDATLRSKGEDIYYNDGMPLYPTDMRLTPSRVNLSGGRFPLSFTPKDGYIFMIRGMPGTYTHSVITPDDDAAVIESNVPVKPLIVNNNVLYYIRNVSSEYGDLYSMNLATSEKTLLVENVSAIADADGDKIYFGGAGEVRVYDITTGEYRYIFHQAPQKYGFGQPMFTVSSIYALGDGAYCVNDAGYLSIFKNEKNTPGIPITYDRVIIGHIVAKVKSVRHCGDGYLAFTFEDYSGNFTKTIVYDREGDEVLSLGIEVSELSIYDGEVMFFHDETGAVYRANLK